MIPVDQWVWYGRPAHFISARWCNFRLATLVGKYIVSSVGDYRKDEYFAVQSVIGHERYYETMVFTAGGVCDCGCGERRIDPASEIEMLPAQTDAECHANHMALCRKYAEMQEVSQ